ncbi:MAG TPA: kynureninase [Steroidobacteraceae bacterium]|nr:kynureninase [Steroidobacteraceae bacterium]
MTEPIQAAREALALDAADPLAEFRSRFRLPSGPDGRPAIYLCGNSLGPLPIDAEACIRELLDHWATLAVRGHHAGPEPWMTYHEQFAGPLARLVGAAPDEVVAMNTLTVNLHLMLVSFYRPTSDRHRIVIERSAFPSDRYAIVSQLAFHGHTAPGSLIEIAPRVGEELLRTEDIVAVIEREGSSLALVLLPAVQYLTGQVHDVAAITRAALRHDVRVGWDLAHAIGNVPLALHDSGADFAVWCNYKYLCGGPGAVGGVFVHQRHADARQLPRFAGWWGHDAATRFAMGPDFLPMHGADGWQLSNPPVLALAPLAAALRLFDAAGLARLRTKSLALTGRARELLERRCAGQVTVVTPRADAEHGAQLSLRLKDGAARGRRIFAALTAAGVIGDWREPDVIRLAPAPLYNSFAEVDLAIGRLAQELGTA